MNINDLVERILEVFREYEAERGISVFGLVEDADERKQRTEKKSDEEIGDHCASPP
mgnify:CR=1 FL=1